MRTWVCALLAILATLEAGCSRAPVAGSSLEADRDLMEITVPQLHALYRSGKYRVTEVVRWHIARVRKYNPIYGAVQNLDEQNALATAAREDAEARTDAKESERRLLWGVPIVIKANTSIKGLVTTDGWSGYQLPGHELLAPKDATIVTRLRAAGAIIIGQTNMPDFAASDTNRSTAYGRTGNAYDVRFSPGGSSGGTVTAITSNYAVIGNGTDTGNSIRMPSSTSSVVGVFPTRGLVSIAGIAPLDWLLDNTGPIARDVTDAAIALSVMAGEDPLDPRTVGSAAKAQPGPYTQYLHADALKGKRLGVPACVLTGAGIPFQGIPASASETEVKRLTEEAGLPLRPETREAFMIALEGLRAAGATVVMDDSILADSFAATVARVGTVPYIREGTEKFLAEFGPAQYHSVDDYRKAVGAPLPPTIIGGDQWRGLGRQAPSRPIVQAVFEKDPQAAANVLSPREKALTMYNATLDRLQLDGYVYPAAQMPPPDETMPQDGRLSEGPHSATGWVNMIGIPAVVVPGGFYASGLPFGLELSARLWKDGDLLGWAYAYEQATHHRKPPVLVEKGLLRVAR
jgi:Asp-tRNA(Asn)/Glu-tRNA(Gln) amidotransferase A subunit family amidase